MSHGIRLGLMGSLRLVVDGQPVTLKSRKQRLILAALALADGQAISRDALIEGLWQDQPPDRADTTLNSYISGLRRALEPDLENAAVSVLVTQAPGYLLDTTSVQVDVFAFRDLLARSEGAAPADERELLDQALLLAQGKPLADFQYEDLVGHWVSQLHERVLAARERSLQLALDAGDHRSRVDELAALVTAEPLREHARGLLMVALYRCGRQADALAAYSEGREILLEQLGLDPAPDLVRLEAQIIAQSPELDAPAHPPSTVPDSQPATGAAAPPRTPTPDITLVGRTAEQFELRSLLQESQAGAGRVLLLGGPAGIGKTALLRHLADDARRQEGVGLCFAAAPPHSDHFEVWSRLMMSFLQEGESDRYLALPERLQQTTLRLLPRVASDLGLPAPEPIPDSTTATSLIETLLETVAGLTAVGPVVAILEDLQWADQASLSFFTSLAERANDLAGLLLVGSYRDDPLDQSEPVRNMLSRVSGRQGVSHLTLKGLSVEDSHRLLEQQVTDIDHLTVGMLAARTGGNPLFLTELARNATNAGLPITSEIPISQAVATAIRERVDRLPADLVELLEVASLAESSISANVDSIVMAKAVDDIEDLYDKAITADILEDDPDVPGNVKFVHSLVRETLYESIAPRRRARLHSKVAQAIEHDAGALAPRYASLLARHYLLGSRADEAAIRWARLAGSQAADLYDHVGAFAFRHEALELAERGDPGPVVLDELRMEVAVSARNIGEVDIARARFLEVFRAARDANDIERQATIALEFAENAATLAGRTWWRPGPIALEAIDEVLAAVSPDDQPELAARLLVRRACDGTDLDSSERAAFAEQAMALAGQVNETLEVELSGPALMARWDLLAPADLLERSDHNVLRAQRVGDVDAELQHRRWSVCFALMLGAGAEARERTLETIRRSELLGSSIAANGAIALLPMHAVLAGNFEEVDALFQNAVIEPRSPAEDLYALLQLNLSWHRGDGVLWVGAVEERIDIVPPAFGALLLAESGEVEHAQEFLLRHRTHGEGSTLYAGPFYWGFQPWLEAQLGCHLDDRAMVERALAALAPLTGHFVVMGPGLLAAGAIDLARAQAMIYLDRLGDAQRLLDKTIVLLRNAAAHLWVLEAQMLQCKLLLARGDRASADALAAEVEAAALDMGAKRIALLVQQLRD